MSEEPWPLCLSGAPPPTTARAVETEGEPWWRAKAATDRQRQYAAYLGQGIPPDATRGEASDIISAAAQTRAERYEPHIRTVDLRGVARDLLEEELEAIGRARPPEPESPFTAPTTPPRQAGPVRDTGPVPKSELPVPLAWQSPDVGVRPALLTRLRTGIAADLVECRRWWRQNPFQGFIGTALVLALAGAIALACIALVFFPG